jgi:DNA repair protein RadC
MAMQKTQSTRSTGNHPAFVRTAQAITVSARRYNFTLSDGGPPAERKTVHGAHDVARLARAVIGSEIAECVIVVMVDVRHRVMGYAEVCRGTLNAARLSARDVLVPALLANAAGIVIAHNHPSGDPAPSQADRMVTATLRDGCDLMGLRFLDHVIVTPTAHFSFENDMGLGGEPSR